MVVLRVRVAIIGIRGALLVTSPIPIVTHDRTIISEGTDTVRVRVIITVDHQIFKVWGSLGGSFGFEKFRGEALRLSWRQFSSASTATPSGWCRSASLHRILPVWDTVRFEFVRLRSIISGRRRRCAKRRVPQTTRLPPKQHSLSIALLRALAFVTFDHGSLVYDRAEQMQLLEAKSERCGAGRRWYTAGARRRWKKADLFAGFLLLFGATICIYLVK